MKRLKVYLAGPIEGVAEATKLGWRQLASNLLGEMHGWKVLDPCRRPPFHTNKKTRKNGTRLVRADLKDIKEADWVLLNLADRGAGKAWGSLCELTYAYLHKKPVVTVLEKGTRHPFVEYFSKKVFRDIDTALLYLANKKV